MNKIDLLLESFKKVIEASIPLNCLPQHIPSPPKKGKTYVVGAGKAAAKMAQIFEDNYKGEFNGTVITRYGFTAKTQKIKVVEASHPTPDQAGRDAAKEILAIASGATKDDLVICLLSGGGSALLSCPPEDIDFEELKDLNDQLLKCGASIHEINCVRKHLNQAFGGKLAVAAYPARIITLAISDVSGDDPSSIASGPTVGDPTTLSDAKGILKKYSLKVGRSIIEYLNNPANETPKPNNDVFNNSDYQLIATPEKALQAAADYFRGQNITPYILSSEFEGGTNECAHFHASLARRIKDKNEPFQKPCVILSGGETTVKVDGDGQGGPNTQFMLKMAIELNRMDNVFALACDTDGIDGIVDNAGAVITPDTLKRAREKSLDPKAYLENNDSYNFFKKLNDLINPGPTHTNVNDYRVILIT